MIVGRRELIGALALASIWPVAVGAQQANRVRKVGALYLGAEGAYQRVWAAFTEAMRKLGWNENENITFERRFADNKRERLAEFAADLVRLNVDLILTSGTTPPIYAKQATSTIPIVFIASGDPVGTGLVTSLAQPGGNVTGFSAQVSTELGPKRLQLLKDAFQGLSRVSILWDANESNVKMFTNIVDAGTALGVKVSSVQLVNGDLNKAYEAIAQDLPNALVTLHTPLTNTHRHQIIDFAAKTRLLLVQQSIEKLVQAVTCVVRCLAVVFQPVTATELAMMVKGMSRPAILGR
jgi:putative tryptophan/tyrosine transport system substrate-binding protein